MKPSARVELATSSLQDWCSTTKLKGQKILTLGIEPKHLDWKSSSLPLTYASYKYLFYTVAGNRTQEFGLASR